MADLFFDAFGALFLLHTHRFIQIIVEVNFAIGKFAEVRILVIERRCLIK